MITSRVYSRNRNVVLIMLSLVLAACSTTTSGNSPTATLVLPTFDGIGATAVSTPAASTIIPTAATAPPLEPDREWGEKPFGAGSDRVGVYFYNQNGQRCLRYLTSVSGAQIHSVCTTHPGDTVIAVQSIEQDSTGTRYTLIAGRTLSPKISAVSVEFAGGDNTPSFVSDAGFLIISPGNQYAVRVVPIDENGNLVGSLYTFGK